MLTRSPPRPCRGLTLPELVVALAIGGVAFATFALALAHQERVHAALAYRVRAGAQLREGIAALVTDLRSLSPAAGDLAAGAARDSSVELRTTIGTAVACDVVGQTLVGALASFVTPPESGDTAWAYVATDSAGAWTPLPVAAVGVRPADQPSRCPFPASASMVLDRRYSARWYSLELSEPTAGVSIGSPLRITRPVRYALYRSPDSRWYLGRREWSSARGGFETVQPVSGPYRAYAPADDESSGLELRYLDGAGRPIPSDSPGTDRVAQLTILFRAPGRDAPVGDRGDVRSVTVALRNAP